MILDSIYVIVELLVEDQEPIDTSLAAPEK